MALSALLASALCILAPLSIPIGPVPITLSVFVVCLFPYLVGTKLSALAVALYLLIGALGLPVFSGFEGGVQKLLGPTGGFLIGYIPLVLISGIFINANTNANVNIKGSGSRLMHLIGLVLGLCACYALGTAWLCLNLKTDLASALSIAVLPFLPFDAVKLALAAIIGPMAGERLERQRR